MAIPHQQWSQQSDSPNGSIHEHLAEMEIQNLFIGGDLNIKMDEAVANSTPARDLYITQIKILLNDYALVDVWKRKNPASLRGTFHRNTCSGRLDYSFAPEYLLPSISLIQIIPEPLLDHCIVSMDVNIPLMPRGPGYWCFQNYLLRDSTFVEGCWSCRMIWITPMPSGNGLNIKSVNFLNMYHHQEQVTDGNDWDFGEETKNAGWTTWYNRLSRYCHLSTQGLESLDSLLHLLNTFSSVSGLHINYHNSCWATTWICQKNSTIYRLRIRTQF